MNRIATYIPKSIIEFNSPTLGGVNKITSTLLYCHYPLVNLLDSKQFRVFIITLNE